MNEEQLEQHDIHLHTRGTGEGTVAVVFVHGWATTGAVWEPVLRGWPERAGRAIAPDLRGVGWSSKPATGYTLQAYADDIIALLDTLPEPVCLVGHSMGGTICQLVAIQRPDRVHRLVLISPVPAGGVPLAEGDIAYFRSLAGRREGMATVLRSMMAAPPDEATVEWFIEASASVLPAAYLEGFDAWRGADFADQVSQIQAPTVVFGGALEQPLSPEVLKAAVAAAIPGATFSVLPGVGHYPQLESTEALTAALVEAVGA